VKKFAAPTAPGNYLHSSEQLCGLYAQTFFTFRTALVFWWDLTSTKLRYIKSSFT